MIRSFKHGTVVVGGTQNDIHNHTVNPRESYMPSQSRKNVSKAVVKFLRINLHQNNQLPIPLVLNIKSEVCKCMTPNVFRRNHYQQVGN